MKSTIVDFAKFVRQLPKIFHDFYFFSFYINFENIFLKCWLKVLNNIDQINLNEFSSNFLTFSLKKKCKKLNIMYTYSKFLCASEEFCTTLSSIATLRTLSSDGTKITHSQNVAEKSSCDVEIRTRQRPKKRR